MIASPVGAKEDYNSFRNWRKGKCKGSMRIAIKNGGCCDFYRQMHVNSLPHYNRRITAAIPKGLTPKGLNLTNTCALKIINDNPIKEVIIRLQKPV
jgi:hypothetical protein